MNRTTAVGSASLVVATLLLASGCARPDTWQASPPAMRGVRDEPKLTIPPQKDLSIFVEDAAGNIRATFASDIAFGSGSSELLATSTDRLDRAVAEIGSTYADKSLCIEGFADGVGDETTNDALSRERATAVGDYLASQGVTNTIIVRGYGERFASGEVSNRKWRRVDVSIGKCQYDNGGN